MSKNELVFSLYSRPECHLCDDMFNALKKMQAHYQFKINKINIDDNPALMSRYSTRIPILVVDDIEFCEYHLDEQALLNFIQKSE